MLDGTSNSYLAAAILNNLSRSVMLSYEPGVHIRRDRSWDLRLLGRPLPGARTRSPSKRRLDRAREILLPRQHGGADQHRSGEERSSTPRSESPLERCSSTSAGLSAQLVVDAKNDMFGEPVSPCTWTGKDRASLETRSQCETDH
jgi:hypothetical protein